MAANTGWALWACGEYCGVGPDGKVRAADATQGEHWRVNSGGAVRVTTPRNGWASFRLVVQGAGDFRLAVQPPDGIAVDLYRVFYHKLQQDGQWQGDALVPVAPGDKLALPAPDNELPGQTAQQFWVDLFIPADMAPGQRAGRLTLRAGGAELAVDLAVDVLDVAYPDDDCIHMDHNAYGTTFLEQLYPQTLAGLTGAKRDAKLIDLSHQYHAMIFEHHAIFHQLGFTHSGTTTRLFAPKVAGDGRNRRVVDWKLYDQMYGPLLDGSAFAKGRRKPQPIFAAYTPFNPNWPADWLGFGQPGYRAELINGLRNFDEHFKAKGWTHTNLAFFFNHKKRFRFYEWDGDEPRFERDDERILWYRQLLDEAVAGSPVKWRYRCDASWRQHLQYKKMAGVIDFWICNEFLSSWNQELHEGPLARNEIVWTYGSLPRLDSASADVIQLAYKAYFRDINGHVHWLTTKAGADPWFAHDGGATAMFYPGERFGIGGPIGCVRMKVQRNAIQDINLLERVVKARNNKGHVRDELTAGVPVRLWQAPTEGMLKLDPGEWTHKILQRPIEPDDHKLHRLDPLWWQRIRDYAWKNAQEVSHG